MAEHKPSQVLLDLKYAIDHRLLDDAIGRSIHRTVELGVADDTIVGFLEQRVRKHQTAQLFAGPFRSVPSTTGEIAVGFDLKDRPVRMPVQMLCAHCLTLGGSGSGKTFKSRWMILQAAKHVEGLWLFDFRKREYACLGPWFDRIGLELIVVPARKMKLNPLQVPRGVDLHSWASRAADMLVQVLRLPSRATKLLNITVLELFSRSGVTDGGKNYPTLFELREFVTANKAANHQARSAIVDALDPVLVSLRGVLCYRRGWSSSDLARHRLAFELAEVGEVEKDLILSTLVLSEFTSRVEAGVSNRQINLWVCCDEAARLVSASAAGNGMADLVGLVRGTGIGLDLSVQSADIAQAFLANSATKFIGRCGSAADYNTITEAMGLTAEQRRYMAQTLAPGRFVGQLGERDWRHPFVFRVPAVDLACPPPATAGGRSGKWSHLLPSTHESVRAGDAGGPDLLTSLPVEIAPEFAEWTPDGRMSSASPSVRATAAPVLSDTELRYLRAVIDHPGQPSSAYAKLARVGTHQAIGLRKELIARGYLREHHVNTSARGRASIVLEPLPPALAAAEMQSTARRVS